eukprot:GHVT01038127.1.p1 GENE.GHVT01038127.1~~GHVT01038127.1.p1  ORF type:complete len:284 (+),score=32.54 GHVT01038127.1:5330-6181(+)
MPFVLYYHPGYHLLFPLSRLNKEPLASKVTTKQEAGTDVATAVVHTGKLTCSEETVQDEYPEKQKAMTNATFSQATNPKQLEGRAENQLQELRAEIGQLREDLQRWKLRAKGGKVQSSTPSYSFRLSEIDGTSYSGGVIDSTSPASLLQFLRLMPEAHIRSLTDNMSVGILEAMHTVANAVTDELSGGKISAAAAAASMSRSSGIPVTVPLLQPTGTTLTQISLWQLAVGYSLRELEVRDDLQRLLTTGGRNGSDDTLQGGLPNPLGGRGPQKDGGEAAGSRK